MKSVWGYRSIIPGSQVAHCPTFDVNLYFGPYQRHQIKMVRRYFFFGWFFIVSEVSYNGHFATMIGYTGPNSIRVPRLNWQGVVLSLDLFKRNKFGLVESVSVEGH